MKTAEEFKNFYESNLINNLHNLDNRRKTILKRFTISIILLIVLAGVSFLFEFYLGIIIAFVISAALMFFWAYDKSFYKDFKLQVINQIVTFISPELKYEPKGSVNQGEFMSSRLFLKYVDRFRGDDLVYGKLDKTEIKFSEAHAEYRVVETDDKGKTRTRWETIFKGLFFIADFNKEFQGSTVVLPSSFFKRFSFIKKVSGLTRREKLVKLEDPEFNKLFNVYGDDQTISRYVLSTTLIERITEFRKKHNKTVSLSFVDSKMYLAIPYRKNLFEPNYFSSMKKFSVVSEYYDDMKLAADIVEDMNLNLRIWTKQ